MGHLLYVADSFVEEAERNVALAVVDSVDDDLSLTNQAPHGSNSWEIVETDCREKRGNTLSNPSLLVCNEVACEIRNREILTWCIFSRLRNPSKLWVVGE